MRRKIILPASWLCGPSLLLPDLGGATRTLSPVKAEQPVLCLSVVIAPGYSRETQTYTPLLLQSSSCWSGDIYQYYAVSNILTLYDVGSSCRHLHTYCIATYNPRLRHLASAIWQKRLRPQPTLSSRG